MMNTDFRLSVVKLIVDIEAKETYGVHAYTPNDHSYSACGTFNFIERGNKEAVNYTFQLESAKDKSEWMMRPLEKEESLVGLIARKVLAPDYKGFFVVSDPGTQICPVGQLFGMRSLNRYPPGYQAMLDEQLNVEQQFINTFLPLRGGIVGRDALEKKVAVVVNSILRIVSALHGKPHAEDEVFFTGCFLDDNIAYLRPRVEKANASFSWVVKYGFAVPASDLASSSIETREAKKALAYYENSVDAKYQAVVLSSLKAMIFNANADDQGGQELFVRPVQSIQLTGLFHPSESRLVHSNELAELSPTPQSEVDWAILEQIFERVNNIWIEKCNGSCQ